MAGEAKHQAPGMTRIAYQRKNLCDRQTSSRAIPQPVSYGKGPTNSGFYIMVALSQNTLVGSECANQCLGKAEMERTSGGDCPVLQTC